MNKINSNFNLANNFALVEEMNNQGKLTNEEYLTCMLALEQDHKYRFNCANNIKEYSFQVQKFLGAIANNFIESKGLQEEFENYFQQNINLMSNDYALYMQSLVNFGDYLKSKGESLDKQDLNTYIEAKNYLNTLIS